MFRLLPHILCLLLINLFSRLSDFVPGTFSLLLLMANCKWKKALYVSVNVCSKKVLIGDTILFRLLLETIRHFIWSSKPHKVPAACSAKGVPSFLSYFKTLSIVPGPGIDPTISRSAVKRSTDWPWLPVVGRIKIFRNGSKFVLVNLSALKISVFAPCSG